MSLIPKNIIRTITERPDLKEYVRLSQDIEEVDILFSLFDEVIQTYGFEVASYHFLKRNFTCIKNAIVPVMHNFPEKWVSEYVDNLYMLNDPIIKHSVKADEPFYWYDVDKLRDLSEEETRYMSILKEAGFVDGIAIPLFGPYGELAYMGLGSTDDKLHLTKAELQTIFHICMHTHVKYKTITHIEEAVDSKVPRLSPREQEVLKWISRGKSNGVIADILGISEHTVDTIIRRFFKKLGVTSRIPAVVKAIQYGLIRP